MTSPETHPAADLRDLERSVRALGDAESPSTVFRLLLEACPRHAPRASIFLVRRGQVCGWSGSGHDAATIAALREFRSPLAPGWTEGRERPRFGQPAADEAHLVQVEVRGRPIAFLYAERTADQTPWAPRALSLLVSVARMRLEFDLALRKAAAAPAAPSDSRTAAVVETSSTGGARANAATVETAPEETAPEESSLAPDTTEIDAAPAAQSKESSAARRFARLVATDIRLYHEEAVLAGQREGDLVQRLGQQIDLGKQTFLKRHSDLGAEGLTMLREAFVEVLAGGKGELIPRRLLD